jgi:hypothetical protein
VLKFDYIDDEILRPEHKNGELVSGWVRAASGINRPLLNIARIKKIYAYDGKLYVLYDADAENVEDYSRYTAPLPPLAVELDYNIHLEPIYGDGGCACKIWRLSISALNEEEKFIRKLLGVEAELEADLPWTSYPLNFTMIPVNITLYTRRITAIAVVKNPKFRLCREESTYRGKYVVLADGSGYSLYRIKGDVDASWPEKLWR